MKAWQAMRTLYEHPWPTLQALVLLSLRLGTGWLFVSSGFGKWHHISDVADYFTSLGVCEAQLIAPIVASLECAGGVCLILGLLPRLSALLLCGLMVGAAISAHRAEIAGIGDIVGLQEFLLGQLCLAILAFGAGPLSVNAWLRARIRSSSDVPDNNAQSL